jgi:tetratricopeptide (TPR) repeat protein
MVRDGLADETGAKAIEQRGIDFAPTGDFLQNLKAAGASEAFIKALRAAKPPEPASAKKPLHQVQILALLGGEVPSHRVAMVVNERGINFEPQQDYLDEVRLGGGDDELIAALKSAKVTKPATIDPAAQARQAEVRQHVARGAEFFQKKQYADAESEYRAAVILDPQSADLHVGLSRALNGQRKTDEALAEARQALRLNPGSELGHYSLGNALRGKGDLDGAIAEYREALRLNPNNDNAHVVLGLALAKKGDWNGAMAEYHEALHLDPDNDIAHNNLGVALGDEGDTDGAIAEFREALRLNAKNEDAHANLGLALSDKDDWDNAIAEYREALRLNPNNERAHVGLGDALGKKRDLEGAMEEYRETLRLNPDNDAVHVKLGDALRQMRHWEDSESEYRRALRLNPKNEDAHLGLGHALRGKGDSDGAIFEYREVLRLNPNNDAVHIMIGQEIQWRDVAPELELIKNGQTEQAVLLHEAEGNRHLEEVIFEFREAVRLNPNNALAHFLLGSSLEVKGDRVGAMEEYRLAYTLDPTDADYKQRYERLLRHMKK